MVDFVAKTADPRPTNSWYHGPMKFEDRALLKVYIEAVDLQRIEGLARGAGKKVGEYARDLILGRIGSGDSRGSSVRSESDETGDHQDASRISVVPVDSRSAPTSRGFTRTSAPKVEEVSTSPYTEALNRRAERTQKMLTGKNKKGKPKLCQHNFYEGCCPRGC